MLRLGSGLLALGVGRQAASQPVPAGGVGEQMLAGEPPGLAPRADATAALRALFDNCIASGRTAVLAGRYRVSGPIATVGRRATGALHIRCIGDVLIEVQTDAPPFKVLLACHTEQACASSIVGGRLTLALSGRCASGLLLRHDGVDGGTVHWGPVTVRDAVNLAADDRNENQGLMIHGRFRQVDLQAPRVEGVDRRNARGGACKGISISEVAGPVTLQSPYVERVRCGSGDADADGISVFTRLSPDGVYAWRDGEVQILQPVLRDCQGRSLKLQASEVLIDRPRIYRREMATISVPDIDFQVGNGLLRDPLFDYRLRADGGNALHPGLYPISLQQQCTDRPMLAQVVGGLLRSDMVLPRLAMVTIGERAQDNVTVLQGLHAVSSGPASAGLFARAVVEFSGAQAARAPGDSTLVVKQLRVPAGRAPWLGYTEASEAAGRRVAAIVSDNDNTAPQGARAPATAPLSGPAMPRWRFLRDAGATMPAFVAAASERMTGLR